MILTIAIPTYNRNEILLDNIGRLLPQLRPGCKLVIVDNCSDVPVAQTLSEVLAQFPDIDCEMVRNRANIGGNANIMRCFELCQTPWLWILGDDDVPTPDAIETIFKNIEDHPDCLLLNFSYDHLRRAPFATSGLDELVRKLDRSADLPWVSTSIYRADALTRFLKFGYQYTYALLPHMAMFLVALGDAGRKGTCFFSPRQIVAGELRDTPIEQQWSIINLALGYPLLLDLPMSTFVRRGLARKLLRTNRTDGIKLRTVVYELLKMSLRRGDKEEALYLYDQVYKRHDNFNRGAKRKIMGRVYRLLLQFPRLSYRALAFVYKKTKNKDLDDVKLPDRYKRM